VQAQAQVRPQAPEAIGYPVFLKNQWSKLEFKLAPPNDLFPLVSDDRSWLNAGADPVQRNQEINRRYFQLGVDLNHCMNPNDDRPIGNWYIFATWASVSAGDVINGNKFDPKFSYLSSYTRAYQHGRMSAEELTVDSRFDEAIQFANFAVNGLGLKQWSRIQAYTNEQVKIFAETNYQIAAEMIPVGQEFLNLFCSPSSADAKEQFFYRFNPDEELLQKAFQHYAEALAEKNTKLRYEKILLASIEQVFYEQARVQKNLERSLISPLIPNQILGPKTLTKTAGFYFGQQGVKLHRDLKVVTLAPELKKIENPDLVAIFHSLGLTANNPGRFYRGSACKNWADLACRKQFLAPLFRELLVDEPDLYEFSK